MDIVLNYAGGNDFQGAFNLDSKADAVSLIASTNDIAFGSIVFFDGDNRFKLPSSVNDRVAGVLTRKYPIQPNALSTLYSQDDVCPILRRGRVLLICESEAQRGQQVHVRVVAGVLGDRLGAVRNTAIAGQTIPLNCTFIADRKTANYNGDASVFFNAF